jgi:hypothetical protein
MVVRRQRRQRQLHRVADRPNFPGLHLWLGCQRRIEELFSQLDQVSGCIGFVSVVSVAKEYGRPAERVFEIDTCFADQLSGPHVRGAG